MAAAIQLGIRNTMEEAAAALIEAATQHHFDKSSHAVGRMKRGVRWEVGIPETGPLGWLNHHDHLIRMYCSNRERRLQIAALGCADMLRYKDDDTSPREALEYVFACLNELPDGMRYYGGMRFHDNVPKADTPWQRFGRVRFVLPSIELIRTGEHTILAANLVSSADEERDRQLLIGQLGRIQTPPVLPAAHLPFPVNRHNLPDREGWETMMEQAGRLLEAGLIQKIVLARRCTFDFGEPLQPMALMQRLHEASPDSFHFCFNYGNEIAFIGATPERLYHRTGNHVDSEALAGTRPRGATEDDDAWLAADLMASEKERREHRLVTESIRDTLRTFCHSITRESDPTILKLKYVQHLRTVISGELHEDVSDADLLLALHPTPAVGGYPKEEALCHLRELEPFDRGWYAAPIGWAMKNEVEFAVAIRCALVENSRLALFSGAGIMPESDPEQEWREIESKIGNFLRILTS